MEPAQRLDSRDDAERESERLRQQVKKLLTAWAVRSKDQLESAEWHEHWDDNEDVLVVITTHEVVFKVSIQLVQFTVAERSRRALEKKRKKQEQSGG